VVLSVHAMLWEEEDSFVDEEEDSFVEALLRNGVKRFGRVVFDMFASGMIQGQWWVAGGWTD
jgi:hypothetical protein